MKGSERMAGQLQTHSYVKTYDELQRSIKRMENYQEVYKLDISKMEKESLKNLIVLMKQATNQIPEHHRTTRFKRNKGTG